MKIALISDIHANVLALQAVLADTRRQKVDRIFNLGDILYGPLWPQETHDLLQSLNAETIQGNEDRDVYDAAEELMAHRSVLRFTVQSLSERAIGWLRSLPKTHRIDDVFLCHGTPDSDLIYLLEDVSDGTARLRKESEIVKQLGDCAAPVVVCGHTHTARVVRLSSGQLIVNPGSVGLPAYLDEVPVKHRMQSGTPNASYALLEKRMDGWQAEIKSIAYDHDAAARQARQLGTVAGNYWAQWLATGRAD